VFGGRDKSEEFNSDDLCVASHPVAKLIEGMSQVDEYGHYVMKDPVQRPQDVL
jgi:hypothetical protein